MHPLRSIALLALLALFMTGGDCSSDGSSNQGGQDVSSTHSITGSGGINFDGGSVVPIPEPSSALIFALALMILAGIGFTTATRRTKLKVTNDIDHTATVKRLGDE